MDNSVHTKTHTSTFTYLTHAQMLLYICESGTERETEWKTPYSTRLMREIYFLFSLSWCVSISLSASVFNKSVQNKWQQIVELLNACAPVLLSAYEVIFNFSTVQKQLFCWYHGYCVSQEKKSFFVPVFKNSLSNISSEVSGKNMVTWTLKYSQLWSYRKLTQPVIIKISCHNMNILCHGKN